MGELSNILWLDENRGYLISRQKIKIQQNDTVIVTEKDSAGKLSGDVRVVAPGERLTVDGVKIAAVPAYNVDKQFHPKANGWLGFIIEIEGVRVYHACDTDL